MLGQLPVGGLGGSPLIAGGAADGPFRFPLNSARASALASAAVLADAPCVRGSNGLGSIRVVSYDADASFDRNRDVCVCVGAFDGVHLGHRALVRACVVDAHARGASCVAVTFDPDPSEVLGVGQPRLLSADDRVRALSALGVDEVATVRFDDSVMQTGYREFVTQYLGCLGHLRSIHVGRDFRLGRDGEGDVERLAALGQELGFEVIGHELVRHDGSPVSATRIRALLGTSDVRGAASLLGRCHFVRGRVVHGRGEGTSFGFPTANVECEARSCMPADGVYAALVVRGNEAWPAAVNVGAPPTFSASRGAFLEGNLLGFEGDLYDSVVEVVFLEFLRPSRAFSSIEELERTVLGNIDWVANNVGRARVEVCA